VIERSEDEGNLIEYRASYTPRDVDLEAIQLTSTAWRSVPPSAHWHIGFIEWTKREQCSQTLRGHGGSSPEFAGIATDEMRSPPAGGPNLPQGLGRRPVKKPVFRAGTSVTLGMDGAC
jgi:hypothetical protein